MNTGYFVSAYATSPSSQAWEPELESQYFLELKKSPKILGIEHPFSLNEDKYPLPWLLENIPQHWSFTITTLPYFMNITDPFVGLASTQEEGRAQAVALMQQVCDYVAKLNQAFNRPLVKAVHLHSFPNNDQNNKRSHKEALITSLKEIKSMGWGQTQLNLEHCDAYVSTHAAEKGFLPLEDEIEALKAVHGYGIILNWARSAIEGHSSSTPLQHIEMAIKSGLLQGFFFSGCTDNKNNEYGYWKDTHMPPKNFIHGEYLQDDSLLGKDEITQSLRALSGCNNPLYMGVKVHDPSHFRVMAKRVGLNLETIHAVNSITL